MISILITLLLSPVAQADWTQLEVSGKAKAWPVLYEPEKYVAAVFQAKNQRPELVVYDLKNERILKSIALPKRWRKPSKKSLDAALKKVKIKKVKLTSNDSLTVLPASGTHLQFVIGGANYKLNFESYRWKLRTDKRKIKRLYGAPPNSELMGAITSENHVAFIFSASHEKNAPPTIGFSGTHLKTGFKKEKIKHP